MVGWCWCGTASPSATSSARLDTRPPGAELTPTGPRAGQGIRAGCRAAGAARAFGGHPGVADGRGDRRRTRRGRRMKSSASTRCRSASWKTATTTRRSRNSMPSTSDGITANSTCRCPAARPPTTCWTATCRCSPTCGCATSTTTTGPATSSSSATARRSGWRPRCWPAWTASFALDNHLDNAESVVLAPITDGRWSCVRWGTLTPPFYPEPEAAVPVADAVRSSTDPMG